MIDYNNIKGKLMKDQHEKIKGYRDLTQEEIDLMNEVKVKGAELGEIIEKLDGMDMDKRWLEIGKNNIQQGLMAVTRAITKPNFF